MREWSVSLRQVMHGCATNKLHLNIGLDFIMSDGFMLYGVMVLLLLLLDLISVQIQFVMSLCSLLEPFPFSPFIMTFPF